MKIEFPKYPLEKLSGEHRKLYDNLDCNPYGETLATSVADKLLKGKGLYHSHRDYCGVGLYFHKDIYTLAIVYDGADFPYHVIATFENKFEFIAWLGKENDQSMSLFGEGFNNQTITKIRIDWFLDDEYSPVWNDYCDYIRKRNGL